MVAIGVDVSVTLDSGRIFLGRLERIPPGFFDTPLWTMKRKTTESTKDRLFSFTSSRTFKPNSKWTLNSFEMDVHLYQDSSSL